MTSPVRPPRREGFWLLGKYVSCKFEPALFFVPTVIVDYESYMSLLPFLACSGPCFILLVSPYFGLCLPVMPARPTL